MITLDEACIRNIESKLENYNKVEERIDQCIIERLADLKSGIKVKCVIYGLVITPDEVRYLHSKYKEFVFSNLIYSKGLHSRELVSLEIQVKELKSERKNYYIH